MKTILWFLLTCIASLILVLSSKIRRSKNRVLVIQWAKLGDLVCTTPIFRAIKQAHPKWEVHVYCRARCADALKNNPYVDRVHAVSGSRERRVLSLQILRFRAVINCMPDAFASTIGIWCMAPVRINTYSLARGKLVRWTRLFNTKNYEYRIRTRTHDHYMKILEPLKVPAVSYALDFFPSNDDRSRVETWMKEKNLQTNQCVCLNVSAGNAIKEWPPEHCASFADAVTEEFGKDVVLSTTDAKRVSEICSMVKHSNRVHDGSVFSLGELGALCSRSSAYVAVDTGPLYVAHAVGCPIVALVGGSDIREQILPEGEKVAHAMPPAGCEPWIFVSLTPRSASLEQLRSTRDTSPQTVLAALKKVMR